MSTSTSARRRAARTTAIGMVLLLTALLLPSLAHGASATASPPVVVSLTWDDGRSSQVDSVPIQQRHAMPATYYVNSSQIGSSGYYLSKVQLDSIAAAGNELGGHTQHHENLTNVTLDQARATVCNDRSQLGSWYGPAATRSFAYPYGATNADVTQIVKDCGYTSARGVTGVMTPTTCLSCRPSESLPPLDPYLLVSPTSVGPTTTLSDLQFQVQQAAANGGGWVIYTMHSIGVPGDSLSVDPTIYSKFLDWLAARSDVQVRTVGDVMSQTWTAPTTTTTAPPPPAPTPAAVTVPNAGLETDANNDGLSDCWQRGSSGTNTASWKRVTDAHSGTAAEQVTISTFTSGDRKIVSSLDAGTANGGCAPSVDTTHSYRVSAWYRSTAQTEFVLFLRDAAGGWRYWRTGPKLPASASWVQASYDAGVLPTGTTAMSFGLLLFSVGTLTTDDYSLTAFAAAVPALTDPSVRNASLEADVDNNGTPDCWTLGGYGTNSFTFRRVADAHSGFWGESLVISSLSSGDRKIVPTLDDGTANGGCAPSALPGTRYRLSAWYHADTTVQLIAYYRDQAGIWRWWVSGTVGGNAADWTQASYVTPPTPAGTTAISFGIGLANAGSIVTDDYAMAPVV